MKKVLVTMAIFFLITSAVFAQFSIGPRVGFNLSSISDDPATGAEESSQFNIMFGAAAEMGIAGPFNVEIELLYVKKGGDLTGTFQGQPAELVRSGNYLAIPILAKVKFPLGPVKPYGFLGPNIGILLSAHSELTVQGQSQGEVDIKDQLSSIDFALDFGGGAAFSIVPLVELFFDVRYSLGLSNISDPPQQPGQQQQESSAKTRGLQFMIGAMFGL